MDVNGPGSVHGAFPVKQVESPREVHKAAEPQPAASGDEVEISSVAKMLDEMSGSSEIRAERLAQIKAAIEAGTYETPEKLEAALEKLLDEINFDGNQGR